MPWRDLWKIGIAEGFGIFFLLFLVVTYLLWKFVQEVMKENQDREMRYIDNIDRLSKALVSMERMTQCLVEMRAEQKERHDLLVDLLTGQMATRETVMRRDRGDSMRRWDDPRE